MSISISEAARRWRVGRETIYRRHRKGDISFLEGTPPTIDTAEMLRVFGEPVARKPADADQGDVAAQARAEAELDAARRELERLRAELASAKNELRSERDDARKERDRILALLESQQRLIEDQSRKPTLLERIGITQPRRRLEGRAA